MSPEKLLLKIIPILNQLKINYYITGGFAVSVWGRPRATFDIDIIIKLVEPQVKNLTKALKRVSQDGYIDEDTARQAIKQKSEFNFIDPDSGFKIDFWIMKNDKKAEIEYTRRKAKKINGQKIYFISPEDLILSKLIWYKECESERHLEDALSVIKISKIDLNYLKKQAKTRNILSILNKII